MLRIYMLGSGPIAVPVLKKLHEQSRDGLLDLIGVGTQPDRPAGRKRQLTPTPVGSFAAENNIAIDKFVNLNDETALAKIGALQPDFLLVVSYGQLLKKPLLELPRFGCVNIHASLLPRYRGASPIASAIASGDPATGVCFMDMEIGLDSGKVYETVIKPLDGSEYADLLEITLGEMAAERTLEVLEKIADGTLPGTVQDPAQVTMTTKIRKSDGIIDWQQSASAIEAKIRAYAPWPGAIFALPLNGDVKNIQITRAKIVENANNIAPGTVIQADRKGWVIACGNGALELQEIIPPGKKAMTAANFLNGCRESLTGLQLKTGQDNV